MKAKVRIALFVGVMSSIVVAVSGVVIWTLYTAALNSQHERLREIVQARARLIEALARHDAKETDPDVSSPGFAMSLNQIRAAHRRFKGFGETGEFTLAQRRGDDIVFLLSQRHGGNTSGARSATVPFASELAEPMRHALRGESGTLVGRDYRGATVLAAYEPVAVYGLGVVAKIDLSEIRRPFVRAVGISSVIGLLLIGIGARLIISIGNPLVKQLQESVATLESEVDGHVRARKALAESEIHFRTLVENSPLATMVIDPDGRVADLNRMFCSTFGFEMDDLPTLDDWWARAVPDDEKRAVAAASVRNFAEELEAGGRQPAPVSLQVVCKDGDDRWVDLTAGRVGDRTLVVLNDVTEQRRLEDQLHTSRRLEAIGRLSGGIAHDFNNMLVVILTLTSMAIEELEPESQLWNAVLSLTGQERGGW